MSAFGPKQTSASALHMSAFGGKADMSRCIANVEADIALARAHLDLWANNTVAKSTYVTWVTFEAMKFLYHAVVRRSFNTVQSLELGRRE